MDPVDIVDLNEKVNRIEKHVKTLTKIYEELNEVDYDYGNDSFNETYNMLLVKLEDFLETKKDIKNIRKYLVSSDKKRVINFIVDFSENILEDNEGNMYLVISFLLENVDNLKEIINYLCSIKSLKILKNFPEFKCILDNFNPGEYLKTDYWLELEDLIQRYRDLVKICET